MTSLSARYTPPIQAKARGALQRPFRAATSSRSLSGSFPRKTIFPPTPCDIQRTKSSVEARAGGLLKERKDSCVAGSGSDVGWSLWSVGERGCCGVACIVLGLCLCYSGLDCRVMSCHSFLLLCTARSIFCSVGRLDRLPFFAVHEKLYILYPSTLPSCVRRTSTRLWYPYRTKICLTTASVTVHRLRVEI
jgi:hypothetical protein